MKVARALLSAGAKVDLQGASPMYVTCLLGHVEAACALLSAGASVDLPDNRGCSPLLFACCGGHMRVAEPCCLRGRGQTSTAKTAPPPWMCCPLLYALKWSE